MFPSRIIVWTFFDEGCFTASYMFSKHFQSWDMVSVHSFALSTCHPWLCFVFSHVNNYLLI